MANGVGNTLHVRDIYINQEIGFVIDYEGLTAPFLPIKKVKKIGIISIVLAITAWLFFVILLKLLKQYVPVYIFAVVFILAVCSTVVALKVIILLFDGETTFLGMKLLWKDTDMVVSYWIQGECPICQGTVYLKNEIKETDNHGNKRIPKLIGVCKNNQDHRYTFDHTVWKGKFDK